MFHLNPLRKCYQTTEHQRSEDVSAKESELLSPTNKNKRLEMKHSWCKVWSSKNAETL